MTRGRLLLVTYSFPPDRRVGALRWQRLIPAVTARGWEIDVLTLDPSSLPPDLLDRSPSARPPEGVRVYGVTHPQPGIVRLQSSVLRLLRRFRGQRGGADVGAASSAPAADAAAEPRAPRGVAGAIRRLRSEYLGTVADLAERAWGHVAVAKGRELVARERYAGVISSGPPHVAHWVAYQLAQRAGIPHVVDFRDPWSGGRRLDDELNSRFALWRARRNEERVVAAASRIVTNTGQMQAFYEEQYPSLRSKLMTIMNGADEDPLPPTAHEERFLVAYAGAIYIDRDPTPLFRGAARVIRELGLTPDQFGIELVGDVEQFRGTPVREIAEREGVSPFVTLSPPRPRSEIAGLFARAQMLVNLPQDTMTQIPAKTFEYVRMESWILVFTPPGSATDLLLRDSGADVVGLDDAEGAARALKERYLQYRAGVRPRPLNADGRYSRSRQARLLVDLLDDALASP